MDQGKYYLEKKKYSTIIILAKYRGWICGGKLFRNSLVGTLPQGIVGGLSRGIGEGTIKRFFG
ncbi:MAG: hypothetical protein ABSA09_03260 [Desulfobaccales bacterium]|jgi:hypothetical protein